MTRPALTATALAALLLVGSWAPPAHAGRLADTRCNGEGCEATAGRNDDSPRRGRRRSATSNPVTCRYRDLQLDPNFVLHRPDGSVVEVDGTGQWYERQCVDARELAKISETYGGTGDPSMDTIGLMQQLQAIDRRPVYLRTRPVPALVEEARSRLVFPALRPKFSPADPWTYVNFPTALWVAGDVTSSRAATAEVPGVRVTVTATPEEVRWDTGDGATEVCAGPGRAPDPSVPGDHGDCSHVWSWPSVGQPDRAYRVTATVFWRITWTAEGAPGGGDLGLIPQRSEPLRIPVAEIQILNTPPGR